MVILKIRKKGFFIELPGVSPFRSPADVDISHVSIPLVVTTLNSIGIKEFEIVSDTPGKEVKLTEKNFEQVMTQSVNDKVASRLDKLEKMVRQLLTKNESKSSENKEQITDKLEKLERITNAILDRTTSTKIEQTDNRPEDRPLDTFIPSIDLSGIKIQGATNEVIKKEEDDTDESADLLSNLTGGKINE